MSLADDVKTSINDCKRNPEMMKAMAEALQASLNSECLLEEYKNPKIKGDELRDILHRYTLKK